MTKTRSYFTASKKSKIAIAAVEGKLTQAQISSEDDVHATQIKAWKQTALKAIETKKQLDFLTRNDCNIIQGFYFSKPLRASELMTYISDRGLSE